MPGERAAEEERRGGQERRGSRLAADRLLGSGGHTREITKHRPQSPQRGAGGCGGQQCWKFSQRGVLGRGEAPLVHEHTGSLSMAPTGKFPGAAFSWETLNLIIH